MVDHDTPSALARLAEAHGVAASYVDSDDVVRHPPASTLAAADEEYPNWRLPISTPDEDGSRVGGLLPPSRPCSSRSSWLIRAWTAWRR